MPGPTYMVHRGGGCEGRGGLLERLRLAEGAAASGGRAGGRVGEAEGGRWVGGGGEWFRQHRSTEVRRRGQ